MEPINLTQRAELIVDTLRREGFNGLRFARLKVENDLTYEEVEDEMTREEWDKQQRDMAYFIAEPEFPYFSDDDSPYVEPRTFDTDRYYRDLTAFVQSQVGPDVTVRYREGCNEFELLRPAAAIAAAAKGNP